MHNTLKFSKKIECCQKQYAWQIVELAFLQHVIRHFVSRLRDTCDSKRFENSFEQQLIGLTQFTFLKHVILKSLL